MRKNKREEPTQHRPRRSPAPPAQQRPGSTYPSLNIKKIEEVVLILFLMRMIVMATP
jgi:hypothetical protein